MEEMFSISQDEETEPREVKGPPQGHLWLDNDVTQPGNQSACFYHPSSFHSTVLGAGTKHGVGEKELHSEQGLLGW